MTICRVTPRFRDGLHFGFGSVDKLCCCREQWTNINLTFPIAFSSPFICKSSYSLYLNTINFFLLNVHITLWMSHLLLIMKLIRNRWEQYSQPKKWMTIGVSLLNELLLTVILVPNPYNGRSSSSSSWIHLTSLLVQWSIKFAG